MSDAPRNIRFHDGASPVFRKTVLDAYTAIPSAIRRRVESFAGAETIIRTMRRTYDSGDWAGEYVSPLVQDRQATSLPLQQRAVTRAGRPLLYLAEFTGRAVDPLEPQEVRRALHHELGHRIDTAIAGDNYMHGPMRERQLFAKFSSTKGFLDAFRKDLEDAGFPLPGGEFPPNFPVWNYIRPPADPPTGIAPPNERSWRQAAAEAFADIYARRFSNALNDQSWLAQSERTDFGIFRRTGLLVDRAVATFVGGPVMPLNPNPGDYAPGARAEPLPRSGSSTPALDETGNLRFEPTAPHDPHPGPRRTPPRLAAPAGP